MAMTPIVPMGMSLIRASPAAAPARSDVPAAPAAPRAGNLPAPLPRLFGRDEEVKAVLAESLGKFLEWIAGLLEGGNFRFDVKPGDKMYIPPEKRVRIW